LIVFFLLFIEQGHADTVREAEAEAFSVAEFVMGHYRIKDRYTWPIFLASGIMALFLLLFWLYATLIKGLHGGYKSLGVSVCLFGIAVVAYKTRALGGDLEDFLPSVIDGRLVEASVVRWSRWLARLVLFCVLFYLGVGVYSIVVIPQTMERICGGAAKLTGEEPVCAARDSTGTIAMASSLLLLASFPIAIIILLGPAALIHQGCERVQTRVEAIITDLKPSDNDDGNDNGRGGEIPPAMTRTGSGRLEGQWIDGWVVPVLILQEGIHTTMASVAERIGLFLTPERASAAVCWGFMALLAVVAWPLFLLFLPFAALGSLLCCCQTLLDHIGGDPETWTQLVIVGLVIWIIVFWSAVFPKLCPKDGASASWPCAVTQFFLLAFRVLLCLGSKGTAC